MTTTTCAPSKPKRVPANKLPEEERKRRKAERTRAYIASKPAARKAAAARYRAKNREKVAAGVQVWRDANPSKYREVNLKNKYGITLAERDALLASQGFACAICGSDSPGGRGDWHTDHCHSGGQVRGILCHHCNTALGLFKDNPATLAAAITYLGK